MRRRSVLHCVVLAALLTFVAVDALHAQEPFPSKPVRIIVPYPAGGSTDQLARALQKPMSESLGQPVVVENKPGATGVIGTEYVVKSPPDGYTLVLGNPGPNAIVPLLRKVPYDPQKDLKSISLVALSPLFLVTTADNPARDLKEFVALARRYSTDWNFGSVGNGSVAHLAGEQFNILSGAKLKHVPYTGGAPLMTAFGGGLLQLAFVTGLDGAGMQQAGRVKYLAVTTPQRFLLNPSLPAVAEELPGFKALSWFGLMAPQGTPDTVISRLRDAVLYAVTRPDVRQQFADRMTEARGSTPEELDRLVREEATLWGDVIRQANVKGE